MTNEKAIHIIDVAFDIPRAVRRSGEDRTYHEAEIREAKDMAIKALSCSENPNRCEDAISRSDAIRVASGYCHWSNIPKELAKLPSVNPIQCEDVISRQAIIDSLHSKFVDGFDSDRWWNSMSVLYAINKVPSVSTEKTGRWKKIKSGDKTFPESIVCSRCGWENSYISKWDRNNNPLSKTFKTTRYCPNCGAKMGKRGA